MFKLYRFVFFLWFSASLITSCKKEVKDSSFRTDLSDYDEEQFIADSIFLFDVAFPMYDRGYLTLPNYDTMYYGALSGVDVALRMMAWRKDSLNVTAAGTIIMDTGFGQLFRGEYDSVTLWYDKSMKIFDDYFGEGSSGTYAVHIAYAAFYDQKQDYQKALEHGLKALHIANTLYGPGTRFPGSMHWNIGLIYENMEDYENASKHYLLSAKHFESLNQLSQIPRCYDRVGSFHLLKAEHAEAMDYFQQMLALRRSLSAENDMQVISSLYRIASVHLAKEEWALGETMIRNLPPLPPLEEIGRQYFNLSSNYMDIGDIYYKAGQYEAAADYYQRLLVLEQRYSGPHHPRTANALARLSRTWIGMQDPDSAIYYGHRALHSLDGQLDPSDSKSNPKESRTVLGYDLPAMLTRKAEGYGLRYRQKGNIEDLEESFSLYQLAESFVHRLRSEYAHDLSKQTLLEKALPVFEGGVKAATMLYDLTGEQSHLNAAFAFSERSKAMVLLEALQSSQQRKFHGIPTNLIEEEHNLKIDLAFYQKKLLTEEIKGGNADSLRLARYQERIDGLQRDLDRWEVRIKKEWPAYFSLNYEPPTVTPEQLQTHLDDSTALVEYFATDSALYIFSITRDGLAYTRRPNGIEQAADLNAFRQGTSSPQSVRSAERTDREQAVNLLSETGQRMYDWLLNSVPGLEGKQKLVIIPDGLLGYVPFAALLYEKPAAGGLRHWPWLLNRFQLQQEFSASLFIETRKNRRKKSRYLGFAPEYDGAPIAIRGGADSLLLSRAFGDNDGLIPALHYNKEEVATSANALQGRYHSGAQATERRFKEEASKYQILHLAMHALTDDNHPEFSQLLFTPVESDTVEDNQLHAYELYNMELNAELAILSACNTGTGKLQRGEGVMSLSRAFKYAGCPNIMMSLWSISDASARDVVSLFVMGLESGKGKASALRTAQLNYLETAEEVYTHPYYWAAFVLVGDDLPVKLNGIPIFWIFLTFSVLLLAVVFWSWRKKRLSSKGLS